MFELDDNCVIIGKTKLMEAIVSNHICNWPDEWTPEEVLNKLYSEDFYSHPNLDIHEYFQDWSTKALALHMTEIIRSLDPSYRG